MILCALAAETSHVSLASFASQVHFEPLNGFPFFASVPVVTRLICANYVESTTHFFEFDFPALCFEYVRRSHFATITGEEPESVFHGSRSDMIRYRCVRRLAGASAGGCRQVYFGNTSLSSLYFRGSFIVSLIIDIDHQA